MLASACGGESGPTSFCVNNCFAQVKAVSVDATIDPSNSKELKFALSPGGGAGKARNDPIIGISAPSGSIRSDAANVNVSGGYQTILRLRPVAESEMLDVGAEVHPSRQIDFGTNLSFAESVLSVAFRCELPSGLQLANGGLAVSATIDYSFTDPETISDAERTWSKLETWKDVCFAYIFTVKRLGYKRWQCVAKDRYQPPFAASQGSVDPWEVSARVPSCGVFNDDSNPGNIYAFIRAPRPNLSSNVEPETSWIKENLIYILLVGAATTACLFALAYFLWRISRYRKKRSAEAIKVTEMQEVVDNMEQYGANAEGEKEDVIMNENILVTQTHQLQKMANLASQEEMEANARALEEAAANRAEYMGQQEELLKQEQAELEKKQKELIATQKANAQKALVRDDETSNPAGGGGPPPVGGLAALGSSSSSNLTGARATSARPMTNMQRAPPKKKKF